MKTLLISALMLATFSATNASESTFTGSAPITVRELDWEPAPVITPVESGKEDIKIYLELESRVRTVNEAIDLKNQALPFVKNLDDFVYLATYTVPTPSEAYINAVSEFIVRNAGTFFYSTADLFFLRILEAKIKTVPQAMALRNIAFKAPLTTRDLLYILPPTVENPSEAYKDAIANFAATNAARVIDQYTYIALIIDIEKFTKTVPQAMSVKNAGLAAVKTKRDLMDLATFSVPTPSEAYKQAVNDFLRFNISKYPSN
jgi:hypothetical protein